jgi:hypothetical protein
VIKEIFNANARRRKGAEIFELDQKRAVKSEKLRAFAPLRLCVKKSE